MLATVMQSATDFIGLAPHRINMGHCLEWAKYVADRIPGATVASQVIWGVPAHSWVEYDGRCYDAEQLDGVETWRELPLFKRYLD